MAECQALNSEGTFVFVCRDLARMREVDAACEMIKGKEGSINLLFLSVGTLEISGGSSALSSLTRLPTVAVFGLDVLTAE